MFSKKGGGSSGGPVRLKVPFQPSSPSSPQTPPEPVSHSALFEFDPAEILSNPSAAEDAIHGALTLRALRWLDLLERDERDSGGKPLYDLELQVSMFRVISDWLKTSKRTKGAEDDASIPGIDQMRQIIAEEVEAARKADKEAKAKKAAGMEAHRTNYMIRKPRVASSPADDSKLDALLQHARRAADDEDDD